MTRRPYGLLVGVALVMGAWALLSSILLGKGLHDPDGSLGPSWLRMPAMVLGAFVVDVVPRALWRSRGRLRSFRSHARAVIGEHWTRPRVVLVVVGLVSFYVTYVSYRNLKNFLPAVFGHKTYDYLLHSVDRFVMFGHEPAVVLHQVLGQTYAAHILAAVYLLFLPVSPLSLVAFLVWARRIYVGYWYATAQCMAWALGTLSYYMLPTYGPNLYFPWLYKDLDHTGVTTMLDSLWYSRRDVVWFDSTSAIQSIAGFASLHVGIILTLALVTHYTAPRRWIRRTMWVYFGLTVVSTLYFGWHYISDDVAGAVIAFLSVWFAAKATGQPFLGRRRASRPALEGSTTARPEPDEDRASSPTVAG